MPHTGDPEPLRHIPALERAHHSPAAPDVRLLDDLPGQCFEVFELEREAAEWIAGERVEAGRDQHDVGGETVGRGIDLTTERVDVFARWQTGAHRQVPDVVMRAAVARRAGARIPGPL